MLFIISLIIVATGTYAIRGLYFSAKDGKIPYILSGSAIGLISIVGYSLIFLQHHCMDICDNYQVSEDINLFI